MSVKKMAFCKLLKRLEISVTTQQSLYFKMISILNNSACLPSDSGLDSNPRTSTTVRTVISTITTKTYHQGSM